MLVMKRLIHIAGALAIFLIPLSTVNAQSWKIVYERPPESSGLTFIAGLFFSNDSTGWVAGSKGFIFKTEDASNSWLDQSISSNVVDFKRIAFSETTLAGIVTSGALNRVYRTTNGGGNWIQMNPIFNPNNGGSNSISDIQFISQDTVWAATLHGSIYRSTNGGIDWVLNAHYPGIQFQKLHFDNQNTGWVCGLYLPIALEKGVILKTENGGETWEINLENTLGNGTFRTIQFLNETLGWATGNNNRIFKTVDGGNNWTTTIIDPAVGDENSTMVIHSHYFINDTLGWLTGRPSETYKSNIYLTLDGGATWRQQSIEREKNIDKIFITSPTTGYAVTRSARVLRYEARPAECGVLPVFPTASSENIPLQPLLHWRPAPGGADGYRIALGTLPGGEDLLPLTDVGLDTFFVLPAPLPSNTTVHVSIYPYSQYFGEAGCSDAFSFTTAACPAPTVVETGICKNDSLLFGDSLILAAGLYEWTYAQPSGCDSLVQLFVSLFPDEVTETDTMIALGQPYNGVVYERDTTLELVLQTVNGCDSLVRVHLQVVTSTGNPARQSIAMHLFPNPARSEVTLQFGQPPPAAVRVWLFNELGQTVLARKLPPHRQDHRIDVSGLPPGTYRVVAMAEGEVMGIGKLVVL